MADPDILNDSSHINGQGDQHTDTIDITMNEPTDDNDSALGTSDESDTTSVDSRLRDFPVEHDRSYHAWEEDKYFQPNDELAQANLNILHRLCLMTFDNKLYLAPLEGDIHRVLDIGTGTGAWAIDFADNFPSAVVTGTDLSPIQPENVPTNCNFVIDDAELNFTFAENSFDYIHIRSLFGCIQSWPHLYAQCYRCLKPGGYIEQLEFSPGCTFEDTTSSSGSILSHWMANALDAFTIRGRDIMVYQKMADWIELAGFEDVTELKHLWPVGPWPEDEKLQDQGRLALEHLNTGLEGWSMRVMTKHMGWSQAEVIVACAGVRRALSDQDLRANHEMAAVYARKPGGRRNSIEDRDYA